MAPLSVWLTAWLAAASSGFVGECGGEVAYRLRGGAANSDDDRAASPSSLRELRRLLHTLEDRVARLAERRDGEAPGLTEEQGDGAEGTEAPGQAQAARLVHPSLGDRVRVRPSVRRPAYEWGGLPKQAVGKLVDFSVESADCTIDFPQYSGWRGVLYELERVTAAADVPRAGDVVRLKPGVRSPAYSWPNGTQARIRLLRDALVRHAARAPNAEAASSARRLSALLEDQLGVSKQLGRVVEVFIDEEKMQTACRLEPMSAVGLSETRMDAAFKQIGARPESLQEGGTSKRTPVPLTSDEGREMLESDLTPGEKEGDEQLAVAMALALRQLKAVEELASGQIEAGDGMHVERVQSDADADERGGDAEKSRRECRPGRVATEGDVAPTTWLASIDEVEVIDVATGAPLRRSEMESAAAGEDGAEARSGGLPSRAVDESLLRLMIGPGAGLTNTHPVMAALTAQGALGSIIGLGRLSRRSRPSSMSPIAISRPTYLGLLWGISLARAAQYIRSASAAATTTRPEAGSRATKERRGDKLSRTMHGDASAQSAQRASDKGGAAESSRRQAASPNWTWASRFGASARSGAEYARATVGRAASNILKQVVRAMLPPLLTYAAFLLLSGFYLSLLAIAENKTIDDLLRTSFSMLPLLFAPPPFLQAVFGKEAQSPASNMSPTAAGAPHDSPAAPADSASSFVAGMATIPAELPPLAIALRVVGGLLSELSRALLRAPAQYLAYSLLSFFVVMPTLPNLMNGLADGFEGGFRAAYIGRRNTIPPNTPRRARPDAATKSRLSGESAEATSAEPAREGPATETDPALVAFRSILSVLRRAALLAQLARLSCAGVAILQWAEVLLLRSRALARAWRGSEGGSLLFRRGHSRT